MLFLAPKVVFFSAVLQSVVMKSLERSTQQSTPRLESLGKIRKSKGLDSKFRKADLSPIKKSLISNATHEKEENNGKEQQGVAKKNIRNPYSNSRLTSPAKIKRNNNNVFKTAREVAEKESEEEKGKSEQDQKTEGETVTGKATFAEIVRGKESKEVVSTVINSTKECNAGNSEQHSIRIRMQFRGQTGGGNKRRKTKENSI